MITATMVHMGFNGIIVMLSLMVTILYTRKYVLATNPTAKTLIQGILLVASAYAVYHIYWGLLFYAELVKDVPLFEILFHYRWVTWFIGGMLILWGYLIQLTLFMKPVMPRLSVVHSFVFLGLMWVIFFVLLQAPNFTPHSTIIETFSPSLNQYLGGPLQLINAVVAGHISIGILSLLVSLFCFVYYFGSTSSIRGFALAIGFVAGGCVLYRLHWATEIYAVGINDREVYGILFNQWWYLGAVLAATIAGFGIHIDYAFKKIQKMP